MYSYELADYIKKRNNRLGGDEILFVTNIKENPQITNIKYDKGSNCYTITTNDNYLLKFEAMPYEEAKSKKLVKPRY